jgi:hypothetical protein
MNLIWRFYLDEGRQWRWQQLSPSREVVGESAKAHKDYERCLADAGHQGYVFQPSQAKLVQARPNYKS